MSKTVNGLIPAAIYTRFSTDNQRHESIEDQTRECQKYANANGFIVSQEHIFADEAESGSNPHRKDLGRLLHLAEAGTFRAVIIFNLARLARHTKDSLDFLEELEYFKVEVISVGEGLRTSDPNSKLAIQILSMMNQAQVDAIRRDTRKAQVGNIGRGYITGTLPYGYRVVKVDPEEEDNRGRQRAKGSKGEIIEEQALVVRRIFTEFSNNIPMTQIVKGLNVDRVPAIRGKGWNTSTVSKILEHEMYIGNYIWGKTCNVRNPKSKKRGKA